MSAPRADREFMPTVADDLPAGERPMVAVVRAVPGREPQLAAAVTTLTAAMPVEPGCLEFRPFRDATDSGVFYLYEIYADIDASVGTSPPRTSRASAPRSRSTARPTPERSSSSWSYGPVVTSPPDSRHRKRPDHATNGEPLADQ